MASAARRVHLAGTPQVVFEGEGTLRRKLWMLAGLGAITVLAAGGLKVAWRAISNTRPLPQRHIDENAVRRVPPGSTTIPVLRGTDHGPVLTQKPHYVA